MTAVILQGQKLAEKIKHELKCQIDDLKRTYKSAPSLLSIKIGKDHASDVYINSQSKVAQELGINFLIKNFEANVGEDDVIKFILDKNNDSKITSMIIQHPVPNHVNIRKFVRSIIPCKDAEGVHPNNLGRIFSPEIRVMLPTPMAVMELLRATGVDIYGKETVIVGHSDIVGKPLGVLLLRESATVTVCHYGTFERGLLEKHTKRAEILVVAVGKPNFIKGSMIRKNAVIIDVGINKHNGKIVGDVDFESVKKKAGFISPVPGGVGKLTVVMLMKNTVEQFKWQLENQIQGGVCE